MFRAVQFDPKSTAVIAVPDFMHVVDQGPSHMTLEGTPPDYKPGGTLHTDRFVRINFVLGTNGDLEHLTKIYQRRHTLCDDPKQWYHDRKWAHGGKVLTDRVLAWLARGMRGLR